ncbi:hypothetical protein [Streptomyces fructofermentans]|uniref:hypothetical protein n=1 Tax=Streptomyces fructofermentans TaxID=152141 RepID=UPI0037BC1087
MRGFGGWAGFRALVIALGLVVLGAPAASAGGPTSVLVVSPESAESAALYYSDAEYGALEQLLGTPGAGRQENPPGLPVGSGRQINVTWLAHDVSPWRVDRVYPATSGSKDVWIHTTTDLPESMNGRWHRAGQPAALRALLKKLGVLGAPSGAGAGAIRPEPAATADGASAAPASEGSGPSGAETAAAPGIAADGGTGWWWAIPGLLSGAALALTLRPFVVRLPVVRRTGSAWDAWREERRGGPRQELRDV